MFNQYYQYSFDFMNQRGYSIDLSKYGISNNKLYQCMVDSLRKIYNADENTYHNYTYKVERMIWDVKNQLCNERDIETYLTTMTFINNWRQRFDNKCYSIINQRKMIKYIQDTLFDKFFNEFMNLVDIKRYLINNRPYLIWSGGEEDYRQATRCMFYYERKIDEELQYFKSFYIKEGVFDELSKRINRKINESMDDILNNGLTVIDRWNTKEKFRSKDEFNIYKMLVNKYGKENILTEYVSNAYPFHCDFYIKSLNQYIEYQGHFSHGKTQYTGEYNQLSFINDLQKNKPEMAKIYLDTWAFRDVVKRKIAKYNCLNWCEFFTMKDFEEWIKSA